MKSIALFYAASLGVALSAASSARAVNYEICATMPVTFSDEGVGEDAWATDTVRPLEGVSATARFDNNCDGVGDGSNLFDGVLNAHGCTGTLSTTNTSCIVFTFITQGEPNGNTLTVFDSNGNLDAASAWRDLPSGGGTVTIQMLETPTRRVFVSLAHIINWVFKGAMTGDELTVWTSAVPGECPCGDGPTSWACGSPNDAIICMNSPSSKFIIAHEYGHANLINTTSNNMGSDCSLGGGGHGLTTREFASCALAEGWADFVAVDAWNDHDESDGYVALGTCVGTTYNPDNNDSCPGPDSSSVTNVDHAGCHDDCKVKFMENWYTPSGYWPGCGTELDYMRTFWDYHTNSSGTWGSKPSHSDMQRELGSAGTMTATNAYEKVRIGVAAQSGCTQYRRWVHMSSANGINHCDGACENVPSCTDCDPDCTPP